MAKYLGETVVEQGNSPFFDYDRTRWMMYFLERYGQIDGGHHKQWILDQMARIFNFTPIIITLAKWNDGTEEYRVSTGEPSIPYLEWVKEMKGEYDEVEEEYEYNYDEGIAP